MHVILNSGFFKCSSEATAARSIITKTFWNVKGLLRQAIFFIKWRIFAQMYDEPDDLWWAQTTFVILQVLKICRQLWNSENDALTRLRSYNPHRNCIVECFTFRQKNYQDMWHVFSLTPITAAFTKNAYIFESV